MFGTRITALATAIAAAVSLSAAAADINVEMTDNGAIISGKTADIGNIVTVSVYDRTNDLLYVDEQNSAGSDTFEFKAGLEQQNGLKVKVGGSDYESSYMLTADKAPTYNTYYVSAGAEAGGTGTSEKPFASISAAYSAAADGDMIRILGNAVWDVTSSSAKAVTVSGDTITFASGATASVPLTLENITVAGTALTAGNITVAENTTFSDSFSLTCTRAELHSGSFANVTGTQVCLYKGITSIAVTNSAAVFVEDGAEYNNVFTNCTYVLHLTYGGDASYDNGKVTLTPADGREVSVNGGTYTRSSLLETGGEYKVSFAYDFKLHDVKISKDSDSNYTVSTDISVYNRNNAADKTSPLLFTGVYDGASKLITAKENALTAGNKMKVDVPIGSIEDNFRVKLFMWDSFGTMLPLCDVISEMSNSKSETAEYFVADDGNDSNAGTYAAPFKTITAAVTAANARSLPAVIYLRGGEHNITSGVTVNTAGKDITIKPYENEKAVITTAYDISGSSFADANDSVSSLVTDATAKSKLKSVSLSSLGITNLGSISDYANNSDATVLPTLTEDNKTMDLARYPDEGYLKIGSTVAGGDGTTPSELNINGGLSRAANWTSGNVYADGYIEQDWWDGRFKTTVSDSSGDYIFTAVNSATKVVPKTGNRVRFINVPEEISKPGEWYLDRDTSMLYIYPYDDFSADSKFTFNPHTTFDTGVFALTSAGDITFENIDFEHIGCDVFKMKDCENITIQNCTFNDILNQLADINTSKEILIKNNTAHDLSEGGFFIYGGDETTLYKANNCVENNTIYDFAKDSRVLRPAVKIGGCGNIIRNNDIYDSPHMAISISGEDFTVEYNDIHDVCKETSDAGAIYGGQYPYFRNNVIRYNYFHDITNRIGQGYKINTIYFDDLWGAADVYSNVFCNVQRVALVGGGRSNTFKNNIFVDCADSIYIDSRGESQTYTDTRAYLNLYYSPYRNDLWKAKFPDLYNILDDEPQLPKYNKITDNIYVNTALPGYSDTARTLTTVTGNTTISAADMKFADYADHCFTLNADSAAYTSLTDFVAPDFSRIGVK